MMHSWDLFHLLRLWTDFEPILLDTSEEGTRQSTRVTVSGSAVISGRVLDS